MPRAQRSRACQQCRERRVKCDETPEFCAQCRRLGLACSGPVQGSVIIDMTYRIAKPRQRKKRDSSVPSSNNVREHGPIEPSASSATVQAEPDQAETPLALQAAVPTSRKPSVDANDTLAAIRYQYKLPTLYQPSKMVPEALDLAFVSHFVQVNRSVRSNKPEIPWITHLPTLQDKSARPALRLSIRAASMACYATVHRDTTILVDSYRWYTTSLACQRRSLARLGVQQIPAPDEILVPVILSLYEVFAGTTTTSMWHHLSAATKIIEMRGPTNCKGLAFPLFKVMRVSDAHRAMVFNVPSTFSSPDWMTIPFEGQVSNVHHFLVDILLQIPACIALCKMGGSMKSFFAKQIPPHTDLVPVQERTRELLGELDEWAERYPHLATVSNGELIVPLDMRLSVDHPSATPDMIVLPPSFIALTAATYDTVRLILSLLLIKVSPEAPESPAGSDKSTSSASPEPQVSGLMDVAIACSKSVLEIAAYMESSHPVGFDFMRSVFPVVVVGILGPRPEEKSAARQMLDRWGSLRGIAGLTSAWLQA